MQDYVGLRGEVYFPNLTFEKMAVNFGCILNDTEVTRYVEITNNSPMPVKYAWSFLEPSKPIMLYPSNVPQLPLNALGTDDEMAEGDHVVGFDEPMTVTEGTEEHEGGDGAPTVIEDEVDTKVTN